MTPYAVINSSNVVIRAGRCQPGMVEAQAGPGETSLPIVAKIGDVVVEGVATTPAPTTLPLAEVKTKAKRAVADLRWQMEVGGLLFNGVPLATDDRSKLLLFAAATRARQDPNYTTKWKTDAGWIDLDATTLFAVEAAVYAHVASAFEWERLKSEAIDAATTAEEVSSILAA